MEIMTRIFNSNEDVDTAVSTIDRLYEQFGIIPPLVLNDYKKAFNGARSGQRIRFLTKILEISPSLAKEFLIGTFEWDLDLEESVCEKD